MLNKDDSTYKDWIAEAKAFHETGDFENEKRCREIARTKVPTPGMFSGEDAVATGKNSIAIGQDAVANGDNSVMIRLWNSE